MIKTSIIMQILYVLSFEVFFQHNDRNMHICIMHIARFSFLRNRLKIYSKKS